jgi:hypothetical protein
LDVGLHRNLSAVASVQGWDSSTGCLLESLVCSRGGLSVGGGAKLTPAPDASLTPTLQLEAGRHAYARADVAVFFWSARLAVGWRPTGRMMVTAGVKRQTVGGAEYTERPGFTRRVSAGHLMSYQLLLGWRVR